MTTGLPRLDRAWFQRLKLKSDEQLSNCHFSFCLRPWNEEQAQRVKLAAEAEAADRAVFAAAAAHNAKLQRDDEEHTRVGPGALSVEVTPAWSICPLRPNCNIYLGKFPN